MSSDIAISNPQFSALLELAQSTALNGGDRVELQNGLNDLVVYAWKDGLSCNHIDSLVMTFTSLKFDTEVRKQILDCLVPSTKVSHDSAAAMFTWVLVNHISEPDVCNDVLRWLKALILFNMIPTEVIDNYYHILVKFLSDLELTNALSSLLLVSSKAEYMNADNAKFLQLFIKNPDVDSCVPRILWEYAQQVPHLVDKKYHHNKPATDLDRGVLTNFEQKIKDIARKAGEFRGSIKEKRQIINCDLPPITYEQLSNNSRLIKISDIKSMGELGKHLTNLQLPINQLSLLQSEIGIMYLLINGPTAEFLHSLEVELTRNPSESLVTAVGSIQSLLMYGFPCVIDFLSDFVTTWDGEFNESYIQALLPYLWFNTFENLRTRILDPLFRVYVTSYPRTKILILGCLLQLCTNMLCNDLARGQKQPCEHIPVPQWVSEPDPTIMSLIEYIIRLYQFGIQVEGHGCTSLILHCIIFYHKLLILTLKFKLPFFYVIHHSLSYPALFARSAVVVNELCVLILMYKQKIIPEFEKRGLLGNYETQVERVMALADSTYKYLWENVAGERPENFHRTQDEFTPEESVGIKHLGIYPILAAVANAVGKDVNSLSKSEIITFLEPFVDGITSFIKFEELEMLNS